MHGPAAKLDPDQAANKKGKLGIVFFLIYTLAYSGFVSIPLINPDWMSIHIIGGQNLAVVYGIGLIVLAIVMGFIYNFMCTGLENQMNNNNKEEN